MLPHHHELAVLPLAQGMHGMGALPPLAVFVDIVGMDCID